MSVWRLVATATVFISALNELLYEKTSALALILAGTAFLFMELGDYFKQLSSTLTEGKLGE